jgi:4-hydroxy-tetrahydrodipicolinate synthase
MSFRGTYTAIITPFRNGAIDVSSFRKHIEHQIAGGVTGIVPVGTTGESPTVDAAEHIEIIRLAIEFAAGRCEVIAGTGANATAEAIELTQAAEKLGANATLQVCPYYNKPSQEGLYQHFKTIAANTKLPVMLYSVPGRSGIEIGIQTTARLAADCKNIIGIKEAGGSVDRVSQLVEATPAGFSILSGDDPLTLPFMVCGAVGLVSVASNIIPDVMSRIVKLCLAQDFTAAAEIHKQYYPFLRGLMSLDVNPVPIKTAAHFLGFCDLEFRLPLVAMDAEKTHALKQLLTQYKLPLVTV